MCGLDFRPAAPGQQVCTRDHDPSAVEVVRPGVERSSNALARELGMSGARLRQIEAKALDKARRRLKQRGLTAAALLPDARLEAAEAQRLAADARTRVATTLASIGMEPPR